jgi:hypothetical protein
MGNWEFGSDIQVITVEAQVPGFTLNCGNYEVHFAPFMPGGRLVELVSDFRVSVVDKSTSWVSAPFRGPRQGMVLSRLQWNVHLQPLIDENNGTGSENAK